MLRIALLGLIVLSLAHAIHPINPMVYEQDDNGDISLSQFTYVLRADCDAATIDIEVKDANLTQVQNASTFLKYVDNTSPFIGKMTTGSDGSVAYQLPGNVSFMRGLFILVVQKDGYRDKEVHFDLSPCYPAPPQPKKPVQNKTNSSATLPPKNTTTTQNTSTNAANRTNETNATSQDGGGAQSTPALPCPIAWALPLIMLYKSLKE